MKKRNQEAAMDLEGTAGNERSFQAILHLVNQTFIAHTAPAWLYSEEIKSKLATNRVFLLYDAFANDFLFVSGNLTSLLGYQPATISTDFLLDILHPDDREEVLQVIGAASELYTNYPVIAPISTVLSLNIRLKKNTREYVPLISQFIPLTRHSTGQVQLVAVILAINKNSPLTECLSFWVNIPECLQMLRQLLAVKHKTCTCHKLTKRELAIIRLVSAGRTSKEIVWCTPKIGRE